MEQQNFLSYFLGSIPSGEFFALFIFALIGLAVNLLFHLSERDKESPNTPVKFNILFLLKDNWKRLLLSMLLIFLGIRFCPELFSIPINMFTATLLGFSLDRVSEAFKKKSELLQVKRPDAV